MQFRFNARSQIGDSRSYACMILDKVIIEKSRGQEQDTIENVS